ncbi:DUF4388 domain-containing protein [Chitinispirillales bacterium ANBcel5]|uniref:DUF4388 domain-containing protein n=1 Tax=Cellulosispirillum alkaliphilum TaxID=3039283 RepID=UPI002A550B8D|nr:DUF4388 domain-containing protein [Chitinispirillales bacterium ANBcel5]
MFIFEVPVWLLLSGLLCGVCGGGAWIFFMHKKNVQQTQTQSFNTSFVFSGNLKHTSLLDAIQFLEIGRREGILHVYCGRRKGYLTFLKGQVIDAFYRNETGREAIFLMLSLEEGDFYFEPKEITQPRLISETMMDIAFEWDERKNGAN